MEDQNKRTWGRSLLCIFVGLAIGHLMFSHSREVIKLRSELLQAKTELAEMRRGRFRVGPTNVQAHAIFAPAPPRSGVRPASEHSLGMADFLTQDDLEHLRIIAERKKIGEYILGEENPIVRKLGETNRAALVAQIAEGKRAELGRTFAQFGLDEVTSQQLQDHQAKISEAALKAQSAIAQLQSARVDYDKRIRSLLSDEDYATYRVYEDMTPARSEYTKVQTYAQEKGLALEPKDQAIMVDLIHQANSYASVPDLGPYDGVPESAVGHDAVIALNQQQLVRLTESATRVIAIATEAGLPEASRSVLESYFTEQINSKSNVLDSIQDPHRQQAFIEQARQRGQQDIMNKSANHP